MMYLYDALAVGGVTGVVAGVTLFIVRLPGEDRLTWGRWAFAGGVFAAGVVSLWLAADIIASI